MLEQVTNLLKSFAYALTGIRFAVKNERNVRIHLSVAPAVLIFAVFFGVSRTEFCILMLCIGFVIACEMLNTAIEATINHTSTSYDSLARIAKDVAAGTVLIASVCAVFVGIAVFGKLEKLVQTLCFLITTPPYHILVLVYLTLALLFIFRGPRFWRCKMK